MGTADAAEAAARTDAARRRRLVALGLAGGGVGFAAATGALVMWPAASTVLVLGGLLVVPFWVGWRADPEAAGRRGDERLMISVFSPPPRLRVNLSSRLRKRT